MIEIQINEKNKKYKWNCFNNLGNDIRQFRKIIMIWNSIFKIT